MIVITIEGGVIQSILVDNLNEKVTVIDYDTDEGDKHTCKVPQGSNGKITGEAHVFSLIPQKLPAFLIKFLKANK